MQFGWLTLALSASPDGDYAAIHEQVTQACFAETTGFDGLWLTEHNFTGESVYCHTRRSWSRRGVSART